MAVTYVTDIQKLYVTYFGRPAEPGGLVYWEGMVEAAQGSTVAVSAAFAQADEYKVGYAGLDHNNTVAKVYEHLFGHAPDLAGLLFWSQALDQGGVDIGNAVLAIAAGAQGTDLVTLDDRVTAATAFTNAVDTPDLVRAYSGAMANAIGREFIDSVVDAATLAQAIDPANLKKTLHFGFAPVGVGMGGHVDIVGMPAFGPGIEA